MRADLRLFSGSDDGCVRQWDVRSGRSVLTLDAADGSRVTAMELGTPADPMVVTGSSSGVRRHMFDDSTLCYRMTENLANLYYN